MLSLAGASLTNNPRDPCETLGEAWCRCLYVICTGGKQSSRLCVLKPSPVLSTIMNLLFHGEAQRTQMSGQVPAMFHASCGFLCCSVPAQLATGEYTHFFSTRALLFCLWLIPRTHAS